MPENIRVIQSHFILLLILDREKVTAGSVTGWDFLVVTDIYKVTGQSTNRILDLKRINQWIILRLLEDLAVLLVV